MVDTGLERSEHCLYEMTFEDISMVAMNTEKNICYRIRVREASSSLSIFTLTRKVEIGIGSGNVESRSASEKQQIHYQRRRFHCGKTYFSSILVMVDQTRSTPLTSTFIFGSCALLRIFLGGSATFHNRCHWAWCTRVAGQKAHV